MSGGPQSTTLRACLIPGDGIGPEVTAAARRVLDASGVAIEWQLLELGETAYRRQGTAVPEAAIAAIRGCGLALKGPVATRPEAPFPSVNVALRERLGLFLGVRPCRALPGARTHFPGTDVVVLRMLDGDLYAGADYPADHPTAAALRDAVAASGVLNLSDDTAVSVKPISRGEAEQAADAAFRWMLNNGRRRLTVVHKANVMRGSDGAFLEATRAAARAFPRLEVDDVLVDRVCADLARAPDRFDVLFAPMLYGDIVSDLAAALCGGLGLAPGANLGDDCAVFEPVHGTSEKHAGRGRVNPAAAILSAAMMLRWAGEAGAAARVEQAVAEVVAAGEAVTYDVGPRAEVASTEEMTEAIVGELTR
jgi:isocitrate dehydrogenase (NAD+)